MSQRDYVFTPHGLVQLPGEQATREAWQGHVDANNGNGVRWATDAEVAEHEHHAAPAAAADVAELADPDEPSAP